MVIKVKLLEKKLFNQPIAAILGDIKS